MNTSLLKLVYLSLSKDMDLLSIVQETMQKDDKCLSCVKGVVVSDWLKSSRILALVQHHGEYALFIFVPSRSTVQCAADLYVDTVVGIDSAAHCDVNSIDATLGSQLEFTFMKHNCAKTFELALGPECNTFVNEFYRVLDLCQAQYVDGMLDFSWLKPYCTDEEAEVVKTESSKQQEESYFYETYTPPEIKSDQNIPACSIEKLDDGHSTFYGFEDNFADMALNSSPQLAGLSEQELSQKLEREVAPLLRHSSIDLMGSRDGIIKVLGFYNFDL